MCDAIPSSPLLLQNHLLQLLLAHLTTQFSLLIPQYEHAWAGHSSGIEFVEDFAESSSESDFWYYYIH